MIIILGDGFEIFTEALLSPPLAALAVTLSGSASVNCVDLGCP
jgi:hypothetical protein